MLKFFFIFILIMLFFRMFGKYILAGIIMLIVPKIMKKAAQQQNKANTIFTNGNIRVEKDKNTKDSGEFTDYEVVE
jgi:hypothetical protein